jgi:hypothetical protein
MNLRSFYHHRRQIIAASIIPLCLFLLQFPLEARPLPQEKLKGQNITLDVMENVAVITYDLMAQAGESYLVEAFLVKEGDSSFRIPVKSATGDIGEGKFAGLRHRIQWDWKKDLPKDFAGGPEYSVEVIATHIEQGGGGSWVYYVLGVAVIGGGAAALLGGKKTSESNPTTSSQLPSTPPGRPF